MILVGLGDHRNLECVVTQEERRWVDSYQHLVGLVAWYGVVELTDLYLQHAAGSESGSIGSVGCLREEDGGGSVLLGREFFGISGTIGYNDAGTGREVGGILDSTGGQTACGFVSA